MRFERPDGLGHQLRFGRYARILLSTPFLGAAIAVFTWPFRYVSPEAGLDPSWVAGLYMSAERGMDAGTQIVFTYGPLGFLSVPNLFEIWPARLAFVWMAVGQIALYTGLLWATRRTAGLLFAIPITMFAAVIPLSDPLVVAAAVLGAAALLGDWSERARIRLAIAAGALAGIELLGSLRAGPALVAMGVGVLVGLPGRRRTFPAFGVALVVSFSFFWLLTGQGLGNLDDYLVNTGSVVGGYSASMGVGDPTTWWQVPGMAIGLATVAALCLIAVWKRDNMRRIGLVVMVAAVTFVTFKHAIVRVSPQGWGLFFIALLGIGIALAPHVRRSLAVGAIAILAVVAFVGNEEVIGPRLDFSRRASDFISQLTMLSIPGRAEKAQQLGRETMKAAYRLSPADVSLLRSGTVDIAPSEIGVAWAYDLDWDPLPVFQQYSAYTPRLDELNASKLESSSAPDWILWQNTAITDPNAANSPGALDGRWPAFESPAQMLAMFCRYRAVRWDDTWAILRHGPDRCGRERQLETVVVGNAQGVRLPPTGPNEALVVRVDGLAVSGVERLRSFLYRAAGRSVGINGQIWNIVGETAGDGLLLRAPRSADYPGYFRLGRVSGEIAFGRGPGFLTGVDGSTKLTLHFSALPLSGPAVAPRAAATQKRRVQR
jgi:hypothetical protein